jgi:hypothetical protein
MFRLRDNIIFGSGFFERFSNALGIMVQLILYNFLSFANQLPIFKISVSQQARVATVSWLAETDYFISTTVFFLFCGSTAIKG